MLRKLISIAMVGMFVIGFPFKAYSDVRLVYRQSELGVKNGNFSSDLSDWNVSSPANTTASIEVEGTEKYLKITDDSASAVLVYSNQIPLSEGTQNSTYFLKFRTKMAAGKTKVSVGFKATDKDGNNINVGSTVGQIYYPTTTWSDIKIEFIPNNLRSETAKIAGTDVRNVILYFYTVAAATAVESCFDDVIIYREISKNLYTPTFTHNSEIIQTIDDSLLGKEIDINANIVDNSTDEQKVTLLAGLYDQNNKQLSLVAVDNRDKLYGNETLTAKIAMPSADVNKQYIVAMLWSDIYKLIALDQPTVLSSALNIINPSLGPQSTDTIKVDFSGAKVIISGVIDSKKQGEKVTLLMLKESKTFDDLKNIDDLSRINDVVLHAYQVTTSENGCYMHNFLVNDDTLRGNYNVLVGGDGYTETQTIHVFFPGAFAAKTTLTAINNAISANDIKLSVEKYASDFGFPIEEINNLGDNKTFIYQYLFDLNKDYNVENTEIGMEDFKKQVNIAIQLCKINITNDSNELEILIKNSTDLFDIDLTDFIEIADNDPRRGLILEVIKKRDFANIESFYNAFIEAYVLSFANNPLSWNEIEDIIESYANFISIQVDANSVYGKLVDKPNVFKTLVNQKPFLSLQDIKTKFNDIVNAQANPPTSRGSSGGGGSVYSVKTDKTVVEIVEPTINQKLINAVALFVGKSNALVKGNDAKIDLNDKNVIPIVKNDRTLVPVRFIAESLDATVQWQTDTSTVIIQYKNKMIKLKIGERIIDVNGQLKAIDVPAQIENERTLLPLRILVESLDKSVFWDDRGLIIISEKNDNINAIDQKKLIDELVDYFESAK